MSVNILYNNGNIKSFCEKENLYVQLQDAKAILIDPDNVDLASRFLQMVHDANFCILPPVKIMVNHKDSIKGARLKKRAKEIERKISLIFLAKEIVLQHSRLDSKLSDIIETIKEWTNNAQTNT